MKTILIIIALTIFVLFLIRGVIKMKKTPVSKLAIFEHPATFKKPGIEMTSKLPEKKESPDSLFHADSEGDEKKDS